MNRSCIFIIVGRNSYRLAPQDRYPNTFLPFSNPMYYVNKKSNRNKLQYSRILLITPFSLVYKYYLWKTNNNLHHEPSYLTQDSLPMCHNICTPHCYLYLNPVSICPSVLEFSTPNPVRCSPGLHLCPSPIRNLHQGQNIFT